MQLVKAIHHWLQVSGVLGKAELWRQPKDACLPGVGVEKGMIQQVREFIFRVVEISLSRQWIPLSFILYKLICKARESELDDNFVYLWWVNVLFILADRWTTAVEEKLFDFAVL